MSKVFVLDTNKRPLNPVHPGWARMLLDSGNAAVWRRCPFTIILKYPVSSTKLEPLRLKLDPGSKTTGMAIVNDTTGEVVFAAEIKHRGQAVKDALDARRTLRRGRRERKTRYRAARFDNRTRPRGWLPPSLQSRIANVLTWVSRLTRLCPIASISQELVCFDTQLIERPDINGVEYQQGELAGYEVREYLLTKFNRTCAYCGAKDVPLQIEHIVPRARGGTNRISNLAISCGSCNQAKGTMTAEEFGHPEIHAKAKVPLKDAAAINATRWTLRNRLASIDLPVEVGTGGRTKFNRTRLGLPKMHWIDAACVGASTPDTLNVEGVRPLPIKATGHGSRQMCGINKHGFPIRHRTRQKVVFGFQTGDIVKAELHTGKRVGVHIGRIAVRKSGSFRVNHTDGIHHRYCRLLQRADGYEYLLPQQNRRFLRLQAGVLAPRNG